MTAVVESLIPVRHAVEYDGSNAQDIVDAMVPGQVSEYSIQVNSEGGGTAVFGWDSAGPQTAIAETGDYVVVDPEGGVTVFPAAQAAAMFVKLSDLT